MSGAEQDAQAEAKAALSEAIHASWLVWKAATDAATAALHEAEAYAKATGFRRADAYELQKAYNSYRDANSAALRAHRAACNAAHDQFAAALKDSR
jgi:hypothetical protein